MSDFIRVILVMSSSLYDFIIVGCDLDRNMSKQVKEAKEHLEWRDLLKQRKLKHSAFQFSLFLLY